MISAVLDTSILVQAVIGSSRAASARTLAAYRDKRFRPIFSLGTLAELYEVMAIPGIRGRHGWSDRQLREYFAFLLANSTVYPSIADVHPPGLRDATDAKFLALAEYAGAEFLVTNDRRHLLGLRRHGKTAIVTPASFLRSLPER
jgi:uncharacterized protein